MQRQIWTAMFAACLSWGLGCARVVHESYAEPVRPGADIGGVVYYESSPYLLVYPDGKGGISWQILYLPDPTKKRVAKPEAYVAKLETSMSFDKGVLTEANVTADETAVGKALIGAVKTAVTLGLFNAPHAEMAGGLRPQVYKIIVKGTEVEFWGVEADKPVVVSLSS